MGADGKQIYIFPVATLTPTLTLTLNPNNTAIVIDCMGYMCEEYMCDTVMGAQL